MLSEENCPTICGAGGPAPIVYHLARHPKVPSLWLTGVPLCRTVSAELREASEETEPLTPLKSTPLIKYTNWAVYYVNSDKAASRRGFIIRDVNIYG